MKVRRGTLFHKYPELPKKCFQSFQRMLFKTLDCERDLNGEYSLPPPSGRVKGYNIEGNTIPKSSALWGGEL
jgi:hypothetical protein